MDEYDDLALRKEINVEILLMLLELCLDGRKTLIAIFRGRGEKLSKKDTLMLV